MNREINLMTTRIERLREFLNVVGIWQSSHNNNNYNNGSFIYQLLISDCLTKIEYLEKRVLILKREKDQAMLRMLMQLFYDASELPPDEFYEKQRIFQELFFD